MKQLFIFGAMLLCNILWANQSLELNQELLQIATKYQAVGISVVVIRGDEIVFSFVHGQRDIQRKLAMQETTKYRIASISKTITATALMQLYEKELFKLDDDIGSYLGYSVVNPHYSKDKITFRRLLSHTSGLRDSDEYSDFLHSTTSSVNIPDVRELLAKPNIFSEQHAPGYFHYANVNYGIIACLIEKISQQRFDQYCEKHILRPLGITGSFRLQSIADIDDVAVLYRKKEQQWQPQADHYQGKMPSERDLANYSLGKNGFLFAPQGGLRVSAQELANFLIAFKNRGKFQDKQILSPETTELMQNTVWNVETGKGDSYQGIFKAYALGNHQTSDLIPGDVLIGHPGEAYGLISDMYFSSKNGYGIVFITNGGVFENGNYSGWYSIEEDVFTACFKFLR